jgi:NAD(P)-dependent dehydrogenase (short-subunit alcohol dehydrogenase family)
MSIEQNTNPQTSGDEGTARVAELFSLAGDIVVVTGASSGIGQAAAEIYGAAGATVVVLGRNEARAKSVAQGIVDAGGRASAYVADLGQRGEIARVLQTISEEVGQPTVVVANAGIAGGASYQDETGFISNYTDEEWDEVLATNLTGTFETIRAASRFLGEGGRILVTASTAGLRTDPMVSYAYVTTKAAVLNLVRQAALELAPRGIRVNAIAPGPFKGTRIGGEGELSAEFEKVWESTIPLGRMGVMSEIQAPMLFLVSPGASFVTGAVLAVDGGALALSHTGF